MQWAIELDDVSVRRSGRAILDHITWRVPAGACCAILGPNGSGKSTLARVIMGQMWPSHGEVAVLGRRFGETDLNELREDIRIVQSSGPVELDGDQTALDVVLTGFFGTVGLYQPVDEAMRAAAVRLLRQVGLKASAEQPFRTLSNGERMRCLIARALVRSPKLLMLDEVTAGLDLLAREQVLATVHQLMAETANPPTLLMITHHVEELLPETSAVLVLKEGRAAAVGRPGEVLRSEVLSDVYEFPVTVEQRDGRFWLSVQSMAWKELLGRG